jgi:hypothetical protein
MASDLGFEPAARKMFSEMAMDGFAFPVDAKRNITLCYLAETCVRLGDADGAEQPYDLLLPYRDNAVVLVATVCCGANARYLGMLASIIGDWAAAEMHFESALGMGQRLQAWPWLAHTKYEFASALHTRNCSGDRTRMRTLLAEAAASVERFGLRHLE